MAGRFARRVKAWAAANGVPVIFCKAGERKHLIAEKYLETHVVTTGVFLILAAKAPAAVWKVHRSARGVITNLEKKREYACHYSFHIMDPAFGHLAIKMSGHPPFGAQVMLNGHEYVAVAAQGEGIGFTKEGNCFTEIADPQRLARVADAWPRDAAIGRLGQVCDRWIYSACLCFGLDLAEQEAGGFRYAYSVYQAEYSRNLLFKSGAQMEALFDRILDRTRSRLDIPALRTLFGLKARPHHNHKHGPPAQDIVIEKPQYGLSWFQIRFGRLQLKACTKGEHVLRFEATVHNTKELRCRRSLDRSRKWSPVSVNAEDDRGGTYVSNFGGGAGHRDHEELALRFLPRLDPLAHALKLTLRGANEEVPLVLGLKTVADSQLE